MSTSNPASTSFPIPLPDISPLCKDGNINPPCHNDSAMFGHCPPENDSLVKFCGGIGDQVSECTAQDCSDFALNVFQ